MSTPALATHDALKKALHQRDKEIEALRAELTAVKAALPPNIGDLAAYLQQAQQVFDGLLHTDAQGRITWANEAFLERYHRTLPQVLGLSVALLPPDLRPDAAIEAAVNAALAQGKPFQFELPDPRPQHERDWMQLKMHPIMSDNHTLEQYVGLLQDISPKRQAQLALVESEERFRSLIAYAPCVLYRVRYAHLPSDARELLYCSPQLPGLFGFDYLGDLRKYIHPDDRAQTLAAIEAGRSSSEPISAQFRLQVPGQPMRWCRASSLMSSCDEQGMVRSGSLEDITLQKQSERDARQNPLRTLMAMEGMGLGTWEFHFKTGRTSCSPEGRLLLGYPAQMPGYDDFVLEELLHPDDAPKGLAAWNAYKQGKSDFFSCEHRLRCADGNYKWVLNRGITTKRDENGENEIFTGMFADITEQKRSEAAISTTALRLTTTIKKLKRGVLLVDENGKVVLTNASFCHLFNLKKTPEELIGADYGPIQAQVRAAVLGPLEETKLPDMPTLLANREEVRHHLLRLRNGRLVERDFVPVDEAGTNIGFLWKFEDITDSYLAETNLRLREEKYRTIIDNMELGLVELDLHQRVLYANPNYCALIGYTNEELIGRPLPRQLIPPESLSSVTKERRKRSQSASSSYQMSIVTKSGETKWLFTGVAPLYDQDHRVAGSIAIGLDITQQKQMEQILLEAMQQAEQSAKAKEQFLANMSHEIRTPMNAILGMSQLLAKTPLASRQSNYLHAITVSAQNLLVIINDILDLTKLGSGHMPLEQVGFNVSRLCEQVRKTLLYKAEEKGLALTVKISPLVPDVVLGDPYRITQILLNLASNSVKFTEKGKVSIECEVIHFHEGEAELQFVVSDTGIGIDPEYLQRIYQEFSQEDPSFTRQFGGTGLGLSISRGLAQLMGSEMAIESVKNEGTTSSFVLTLPIGTVDDLPQRGMVTTNKLQELRGKHILLVEDNEYNRLMAKTFLLNSHLKVTEAENGQAAIDCVAQKSFDLILMDVQMPVMDGFEATRHLRQERGLTIPIIALTASAVSGEKERCLAAGMDDYLTKPFYEDELLQLLCDWLLPLAASPGSGVIPAALPAPATPSPVLYNLEVLQNMARGDQKFVSSMLQTFISSTQSTLQDLHAALAVGNLARLQAAAHKLGPSLRHLQIHSALKIMEQLENWTLPFSYDDLQPQVEAADRILRQVLVEMTAEQEKRFAAGH